MHRLMTAAGGHGGRAEHVDWATIVAALEHGIVALDDQLHIVACNPAAERLLGRDAGDLTGRPAWQLGFDMVGEDGTPLATDAALAHAALRALIAGRSARVGITAGGERRWLRLTADSAPFGAAGAQGAVLSLADVTSEHERERALRRLAERDDLTGLPNRRSFRDALDRHLASRRREDDGGALLLLDLDHFKELNDAFGHATGDRLLVQIAGAMREHLREDDLLARLGGDEFAVLLRRADEETARAVAEGLVERLRREHAPAPHGGSQPVSASVGAVLLGGAATGTAERALSSADAAMYRVKAAGRGGWRIDDAPAAGRREVGEQLAKRSRQLAVANVVGARLAGMDDAHEIAEATVEELRRAFGYHLSALIRLRPDDRVEAMAVRGRNFDELLLRQWSQPAGEGLIGRCLRERTPVRVNDVYADLQYNATPETTDVRAELVVPLIVDGELWGALNVEELRPDAFDDDDVILLSTLANQVAAALRATALLARLREHEALSAN
jgi:diguanylate cyclase (GGDEF)-like protein/PAS domain S-box-containing protein